MSDDRQVLDSIPIREKPDNVEVFDPSRKRTIPVDLDAPFFTTRRTEYPNCNHRDRGVTLDVDTRKVFCKCGEQIDAFDALLLYAHAEQRLQSTRYVIEEHRRKEEEKKAKKPFLRRVTGFSARYNRRNRVIGYDVSLECGHRVIWDRRRPPRNVTCDKCFRNHELQTKGVSVPPTFGGQRQ